MMKKLILLFLILISTYSFACSCARFGTPFHSYSSSELVADVTFTKVYPDFKDESSPYINVDLKYNDIYKGKGIKTIKFYGSISRGNKIYGSRTSCSLGAKVGQRMIIFMKKDKDGLYSLHYCDHKIYKEKKSVFGINFSESKNILKLIKTERLSFSIEDSLLDFGFNDDTEKDDFEKLKGLNAKERFALFEIVLNSDGTFKNVSALQDFDSDKDDEILSIIKKGKLRETSNYSIDKDEKFTLILFFYPKEKNNLSFVSQYFLN